MKQSAVRRGIPASLADAKARGIPVVAYGAFLNAVVDFLIVAFAIFMIVKQANRLKMPALAAVPTTKLSGNNSVAAG
ncbi:MAG: hypothetical protein EXQ53_00445 [Acidobacteria bacterium]|nr:hypothetical protein [Acidobacteriota bacterium]